MKLLTYINKAIYHFTENESDGILGDNILVVSNTGFGDTILSTPAIISLRKSFPECNIIFLVNRKIVPLLENYKHVNQIVLYTGNFLNLLNIIRICRKNEIHSVFLFHANGPEDMFISMLSGARNILKCTDNTEHEYRKVFMNKPVFKSEHNIERKLDLVRFFNPDFISTKMVIADKFYQQEKEADNRLPTDKKIIGIQLGTQELYKIWPIDNVISLSRQLLEKNYFLVYFGATKLELEMMKTLLSEIDSNNMLDLCGKTKLDDLPNILKQLDLLVTNDTGIMHLAIALQLQTLALFSPSPFKEVGYYQDKELHAHIQKDGFFEDHIPKKKRTQDAMRLITIDEVFSKIEEIL